MIGINSNRVGIREENQDERPEKEIREKVNAEMQIIFEFRENREPEE